MEAKRRTRIRFCGQFTVEVDGHRCGRALPARQGRLLFAYLVLHRRRAVTRDELIGALWPGRRPSSPDACLSTMLSRLRRALPAGSLAGRGEVMLELGVDPWVDFEVAAEAAATAASALELGAASEALATARSALATITGEFLPGLRRPWIDERRRALADLELELLEIVARVGLELGGPELVAAEAAAREAIGRARFRESAHVTLLEVLVARGNMAEATRAYERVRMQLDDEVGTRPSAELRAIGERLLANGQRRGSSFPRSPHGGKAGPMLIGRYAECARIDELLAATHVHHSGVLVLSGEPGIGKSALCAYAASRADGMRVRSMRAIESENELTFAGLSELCARDLGVLSSLPSPQARALEGALARRDAPPSDRFAIGAALLAMLAATSHEKPLLLIVDDAQWLDAASADALLFAARRLRRECVALLMATRPGAGFEARVAALPRLSLDGLGGHAARALLHTAHGPLPAAVAEHIADGTAGNPLALLEVPTLLSEQQLAGAQPIDDPLPVGEALVRAMLNRLTGASAEARQALLFAAASAGERLQPVLDALALVGIDRGALDGPERDAIFAIDGERFAFRHPLLRSAVYHGAGGPARRAAHAALARVAEGEDRAWHLAHATVGEDERVAATLEAIGEDARRRGAPSAAAAALARAGALSAPGEARVRRLTCAARDTYIAGRPMEALRLLDLAQDAMPSTLERADIQHVRGRILAMQGRTEIACELLVDEARLIRDVDPTRAAVMLAEACVDRILSTDVDRATSLARDACAAAATADLAVQAFTGVMLAAARVLAGDRAEASGLLDRFLPVFRAADPLTEAGQLVSFAAQCYFWLERYDLASELLGRLTACARKASAPSALLVPLCCRAELDLRAGRWAVAAAQCQEAADLGDEMARAVYAAYAPECLARLAAALGDEEGCREHAARAVALIDTHGNDLGRLYVYSALGLLELGLGRIEAAIDRLERARELGGRTIAEPNIVHWQADLVESYARAGDTDEALTVLAELERQGAGTGGRWALGTAARCRGLLCDDSVLDRHFETALEYLEPLGTPFEIARTHLCHGERLRRAARRRDARRALRRALDGFDRLGAEPWAARARLELTATGLKPRPRGDDANSERLTGHELQVALIVADGATNKEAAAALFLSPKTIEFHLGSIYRKLGIRTRTELAVRRGSLEREARSA